ARGAWGSRASRSTRSPEPRAPNPPSPGAPSRAPRNAHLFLPRQQPPQLSNPRLGRSVLHPIILNTPANHLERLLPPVHLRNLNPPLRLTRHLLVARKIMPEPLEQPARHV